MTSNVSRVTITGEEESKPVPVDTRTVGGTAIALGIVVTGTVDVTVQHTFDDIWARDYDPSTGTWMDHETLINITANADGNYAFPPTAIRIIGNSGSTGDAELVVVQQGVI